MKLNTDDRLTAAGEHMPLEFLMKRGEQLHSTAIFEMCASLYKGMKLLKSSILNAPKHMATGWSSPR